jgi:hypothetical protein
MTATLYFEPKAKVFLSKQTKVNYLKEVTNRG